MPPEMLAVAWVERYSAKPTDLHDRVTRRRCHGRDCAIGGFRRVRLYPPYQEPTLLALPKGLDLLKALVDQAIIK